MAYSAMAATSSELHSPADHNRLDHECRTVVQNARKPLAPKEFASSESRVSPIVLDDWGRPDGTCA